MSVRILLLLYTFCFNLPVIVAQRTIVAIGDSNGTSETEWVGQLQTLRPQDSIFNFSISGNTIGFDNRKNEKLNTVRNVDRYLSEAISRAPEQRIDDVILLVGTNDCKRVFEDRLDEVLLNLNKLVDTIRSNNNIHLNTNIYVVTPPPIGPDSTLLAKYQGGDQRLQKLLPGFMKIALENDCHFVDIYSELKPNFSDYTIDGIHLNEKASRLVARRISGFLDNTTDVRWDDTSEYVWPDSVQLVQIPSRMDSSIQKAYFYVSARNTPQPLIVSLHTWSGDYTQRDPLLEQVLERDWNYIHPDFRGVNNQPKAMGSPYAINDVELAIAYAIKNAPVNEKEIHVIGASGGGYATLYTFMNTHHPVKTFSAWVPISDIEAWYYQSKARSNKYAEHILAATSGGDSVLNAREARKRSPLYMDTPVALRENASLNIFAGIHDGYTGSVPVVQSIEFYNKVVSDFGASEDALVRESEMIDLLSMRNFPESADEKIGDRKVIFKRRFKNISLIIFEGTHEMLTDIALETLNTDAEP